MARRRARRARKGRWAGWLLWVAIVVVVVAVAGGFVELRNAQVRAGYGLKKVEDRIAGLEADIERFETRIAGLMSRAEMSARLREKKPDLRRLGVGEAIRLHYPGLKQSGKDGEN